jgi:hypothetical protein
VVIALFPRGATSKAAVLEAFVPKLPEQYGTPRLPRQIGVLQRGRAPANPLKVGYRGCSTRHENVPEKIDMDALSAL